MHGLKWLDKNPYEANTDRELFVLKKNLSIYRAMYTRNSYFLQLLIISDKDLAREGVCVAQRLSII